MKRSTKLLLILLIIIGFWACQKDPFGAPIDLTPVVQDPVSTVKYKIEISVIGDGGTVTPTLTEVNKGASITISTKPQPGFAEDSIIVGLKSFPLTQNSYTFNDVSSDLKIGVKFKKTNLWYLIKDQWLQYSCDGRLANTTGNWIPYDNFHKQKYIFDENYKYKLYLDDNPTAIGNGPYILKEDSLIIGPDFRGNGGTRNKIISIGDSTLVLEYLSVYIDQNGVDPSKNMKILCKFKH